MPENSQAQRTCSSCFSAVKLPDAPSDQVIKTAKQVDPDLNVIVVTGYPHSEILDRILQISPVTF